MKETDKEYYTRRGKQERKASRSATAKINQLLHSDLADLCLEKANASTNVNTKAGINTSGLKKRGLVAE